MFLKFRYRLGYESLCAEVSDSISGRRFCRIGLDGRVPHPTTLMKLTTRLPEADGNSPAVCYRLQTPARPRTPRRPHHRGPLRPDYPAAAGHGRVHLAQLDSRRTRQAVADRLRQLNPSGITRLDAPAIPPARSRSFPDCAVYAGAVSMWLDSGCSRARSPAAPGTAHRPTEDLCSPHRWAG